MDKGNILQADYQAIKQNLHSTERFEDLNRADIIIEVRSLHKHAGR
jgi:hypothetical protein